MAHHDTQLVRTADGRDLEVLVTGPADGLPLVFHHGTPQAAAPRMMVSQGRFAVVCMGPEWRVLLKLW